MSLQKLKQMIAKIQLRRLNPKAWERKSVWGFVRSSVSVVFCLLLFVGGYFFANFVNDLLNVEDMSYEEDYEFEEVCNVTGIELHGDLLTYIPNSNLDDSEEETEDEFSSQEVVYWIEDAESDDSIKAIVLEVDSLGGMPVAGEEISEVIKNSTKPVISFIRSVGASASYLAISGSDRIFASKYSEVGGIGVTMSYLDYAAQNRAEGLTFNSLSAGKFKDAGSPDKELTQDERNMFMRDVNIMHQYFIKTVAENRNLDIETVKKMADGSTVLGQEAIDSGLIDQIGGYSEVRNYLKEQLGEDVEVCW